MRLNIVQEALKKKKIKYEYTEIDGCGSIDFLFRGLKFHVWEYEDRNGEQKPIYMRLVAARTLKATTKKLLPKKFYHGRTCFREAEVDDDIRDQK